MTIYSGVNIDGIDYDDYFSVKLNRSISPNNATGSFTIVFPNQAGKHNDDFSIGDVVTIKGGTSVPASDTLLVGRIDEVNFSGGENDAQSKVTIVGRDYSGLLMDSVVQPVVYNNQEIADIVDDLVTREIPSITTTGVQTTGKTLPRIQFANVSVFDVLRQLADIAGFYFYVDSTLDLHFEPVGTTSNGFSFDNTNVRESNVREMNRELYNQVWVYGDKMLTAAPRQTYVSSGTGATLGSVYALDYKPSNTAVFVGGSTASKIGNIFQMVAGTDPGSPTQYLVDYEGQRIIFVSGATAGNNIPASGTSIVIEYDRQVPIAKFGQDNTSVAQYGAREYVIVDKAIRDPRQATETLLATLDDKAFPVKNVTLKVQGYYNILPGTTSVVDMPWQGINSQTMNVVSASYDFNKNSNFEEQVLTVVLNKKLIDAVDTIKEALLEIKRLRAGDTQDLTQYSRLEVATGSVGLRVNTWVAQSRGVNDGFVLGDPERGVLGTRASSTVGSLISGPTWVTGLAGTGFNRALSFGSPAYVNISGSWWSIGSTTPMTVSYWFRPYVDSTDVFNANPILVTPYHLHYCRTTSNEIHANRIDWPSSSAYDLVTTLGNGFRGSVFIAVSIQQSGTGFISNSWVNGSSQGGTQLNPGGSGLTGKLPGMGRFSNGYLSGVVDDVRIYTRALSSSEVGSLYANIPINGSLLAYWKMDEGSGNYIYSSASGGNQVFQSFLGDRRGGSTFLVSGGQA